MTSNTNNITQTNKQTNTQTNNIKKNKPKTILKQNLRCAVALGFRLKVFLKRGNPHKPPETCNNKRVYMC